MSDKIINSISTSYYSITPELSYYGTKRWVKFNGSCLKQDKVTFNHETIVSINVVCEVSRNFNISSYPVLENSLFRGVSLTKHADTDQYKYCRHGIGFDRKGTSSFGNGFGRNCIILGVDISSSPHIDNKKKDILTFGEGSRQGLEHILTAEKDIKLILLKIIRNFV